MKRILSCILAAIICLAFAGCGDGGSTTDSFNTTNITIVSTETITNTDGSKRIVYTYTDGSVRETLVPAPEP